MKKENWFLVGLVFGTLFLLFFRQNLGWKIQAFFSPAVNLQSDAQQKLVLENESLNAELALLRQIKKNQPVRNGAFLPVFVYSRYPFNFKNELLVSAGANQGVDIGQTAVIASNGAASSGSILVGKVEKVFENVSLVRTVFDSRFRSAVRVGGFGTNALLKGGGKPELSLIPKDAKIANGDVVYSASPDFPYGIAIGNAGNVRISSDQLFQEADVETNYNPNELQSIFIISQNF
ncbi:MAG: hypothetical protein HY433_03295 [Candidatus Liptonbacteria bacterium]|nr:hypothetical protein [Candidatus Liptonbacteria bacterium]